MSRVEKPGFVDRLRKIYHSSPLIIIMSYKALYNGWTKIRSCLLPVHLYKGTIRDGGKPLIFSYIGWNYQVLSYWLEQIFEQFEKIPCKKLIPVWKINRISKGKIVNTDLAMVELLNTNSLHRKRDIKGFIIPRWLKCYLDVDLTLANSKKRREANRIIRKFSLEMEISTSSSDFEIFYKKMFRPYIESRHRDSACVEDYKKLLHDFNKKDSTLYFVKKEGRRIAGLYEIDQDGIPYLFSVGILDGDKKIMKMGVVWVLYYYVLTSHRDNNIKRVDFGGTSPLLTDGLTWYKVCIGAKASEIEHQDSLKLLMLPLRNSPAVTDFLKSNPFIYIENNNVNCAIFKDETIPGSKEEFQKRYEEARSLGLNEIKIFRLDTHQKEFNPVWEN